MSYMTGHSPEMTDVLRIVDSLQPGECIGIDIRALQQMIPSYYHNNTEFTSADRVLESIMGSARTHNYRNDFHTRKVIFYRVDDPAAGYVSPDRRGLKCKSF